MSSKIIEEKRTELINEETMLKENIENDYSILGKLVSSNVDFTPGEEPEVDFSNLTKDKENLDQLIELLMKIEEKALRLNEIPNEIENLDTLKICHKCGSIVGEDELFCSNCGERLVKENITSDDSICPQCGKPRKSDGAFCAFCGFKFENHTTNTELPKERLCVKCGEKLPDDVVFCHICGCRQPE